MSEDVLVELEVLNPELLREGFGTYADPTTGDWYARISIKEYSTPEYSAEDLMPVRYAVGFDQSVSDPGTLMRTYSVLLSRRSADGDSPQPTVVCDGSERRHRP